MDNTETIPQCSGHIQASSVLELNSNVELELKIKPQIPDNRIKLEIKSIPASHESQASQFRAIRCFASNDGRHDRNPQSAQDFRYSHDDNDEDKSVNLDRYKFDPMFSSTKKLISSQTSNCFIHEPPEQLHSHSLLKVIQDRKVREDRRDCEYKDDDSFVIVKDVLMEEISCSSQWVMVERPNALEYGAARHLIVDLADEPKIPNIAVKLISILGSCTNLFHRFGDKKRKNKGNFIEDFDLTRELD